MFIIDIENETGGWHTVYPLVMRSKWPISSLKNVLMNLKYKKTLDEKSGKNHLGRDLPPRPRSSVWPEVLREEMSPSPLLRSSDHARCIPKVRAASQSLTISRPTIRCRRLYSFLDHPQSFRCRDGREIILVVYFRNVTIQTELKCEGWLKISSRSEALLVHHFYSSHKKANVFDGDW